MQLKVAIVVPVYSGERYLDALSSAVADLRQRWADEQAPLRLDELVFVDDSAVDASGSVIDRSASAHSWVRAIHLSRNFGQHPATVAGILHTTADWVVTMDEDLQHPPAAIPMLLRRAVETGADVVYGRPESPVHEAAARDMTSRTYKRLIEVLTGNPNIRKANSFRLMRGTIARAAAAAGAHDTYFDVSLSWYTQRIDSVTMPLKDTRFITTGKSGYNLRSLLSHARRMLVSSQIKVLRLGAAMGISIAFLSMCVGVGLVALHLLSPTAIDAPGWTSLMISVAFFSGITIFLIGIVLEYISVLLSRSNGRPLYFVVDRSADERVKHFFSERGTE